MTSGTSDSIRVLFDATAIPAARGGVGRYVDELLPALASLGVHLAVACQRRDVERYEDLVPSSRLFPGPRAIERQSARFVWEQTGLPSLAARIRPNVLHSPHYTMPLDPTLSRRRIRRVVTLHDATFFTSPEVHSHIKGPFFRAWSRRSVRAADALIVPSAATRDEFVRILNADPSRFEVAYHGVDEVSFHAVREAESHRVAKSLGVKPGHYVAFLGTLEPRKNVPALIRGWSQAVAGLVDPPPLLLAGARGWDENIDVAIGEVEAGQRVERLGYLPLEDLAGFLGGSALVAYPSLGEGFGLPVLEAMACGATVLTSRRLSLPEVGGDAVEYCDVDSQSIAHAIAKLLSDSDRRLELSNKAIERAKTFTWESAAVAHLKAYEMALGL